MLLVCSFLGPLAFTVVLTTGKTGIDGSFQLVFGTSCSSPVVGSMITLINDARLAAGKGPVGFLNPSVCFKYNT